MSLPYALLAEFTTPEALLAALREAQAAGYTRLEAITPCPLEELETVLALHDRRVPRAGWFGVLCGALAGIALQVGASLDYPLDIGGRPLLPLPAYAVITVLLAILFGALFAVLALLRGCRLPRLHHPLFEASAQAAASDGRWLLCLYADDPRFARVDSLRWLSARALSVSEVRA